MKRITLFLLTLLLFTACSKSDNNPVTNPSGNVNTISFTFNGKSYTYTCPSSLATTGIVVAGSIGTDSDGGSGVNFFLHNAPFRFDILGDKSNLPITGEYNAHGGNIEDRTGASAITYDIVGDESKINVTNVDDQSFEGNFNLTLELAGSQTPFVGSFKIYKL